jgi:hypothetical protein
MNLQDFEDKIRKDFGTLSSYEKSLYKKAYCKVIPEYDNSGNIKETVGFTLGHISNEADSLKGQFSIMQEKYESIIEFIEENIKIKKVLKEFKNLSEDLNREFEDGEVWSYLRSIEAGIDALREIFPEE